MDGEILSGQTYQPEKNRVLPYEQQSVEYSGPETLRVTGEEGDTAVDINPTDKTSALVRRYDISAIVAALEAEVIAVPIKLVLSDLPDVLNSVTARYNKTAGSGESNFPVSKQNFQMVNSGSGNISPKATAQASASIVADVSWDISTHYRQKLVNGMAYTFNIASPSVTITNVLDRLAIITGAVVYDWPDFRPKQHQVTCKGMQVSVQAQASTNVAGAQNTDGTSYSYSWEYGDGFSKEVGTNIKTETIPPTIHPIVGISGGSTDSQAVSVDVQANSLAVSVGAVPVIIAAITNEPAAVTATASASVLFENGTSSAAATGGQESIPTSNLFLVSPLQGQQDDFGVTQIRAVVVDFSQYA